MRKSFTILFLIFYLSFVPTCMHGLDDSIAQQEQLFNDLMIVEYWNNRLEERLPVTFNHLLLGGYFNMPSARMGDEGEIGIGYSSVPPYHIYNLRCQLTDRIEVSGSYRVFRGVDDPVLTPMGFGDLSDKGVNFKFSLFSPEDSQYKLPGLAFGLEDFMGTKSFHARYAVLTQVFLDYNLECSLGYGTKRIKGFFGGLSWMPFRKTCYPFLQNISLAAEYDAIPYHDEVIEKHPKGRVKKSPINFGVKWRLWDQWDLSASCVRGHAFAFSASTYFNFGETEGLLPKIDDQLPYQSPIVTEPLGPRRSEASLVQDLIFSFRKHGFFMLEVRLGYNECQDLVLRLKILNNTYRVEEDVRCQITNILAYLIPDNIDKVEVVIEDLGFPVQEYHFDMEYVREYADKEMGPMELEVLSPLCEVTFPNLCTSTILHKQWRDIWDYSLSPKTLNFFNSSKGKFKYALGLSACLQGFLENDLYYSIQLGYLFVEDVGHLQGIDALNPSKLPNVRTDVIKYYQQGGVTLDEAFVQKNWNLGKGWYSRLAVGYFEVEYAGIASEFLYYPLNSNWAFGVEGAWFKKRTYHGLGITDKVRQLHDGVPHYHPYRFYQYFLDVYYHWREAKLDFKLMGGRFLANDYGVRTEVSRYFPSGMRVTLWYTATNGHDKINDHIYHDKGVLFSMPLDIFYKHTSRARWSYGLSAWLRDVGVFAATGYRLYNMIREQRLDY